MTPASWTFHGSFTEQQISFWLSELICFRRVYERINLFRGQVVARKYKGNLNGERYVANTSPYNHEVHDLDNESRNCLVDHIVRSRQDKPFGSLEDARREQFIECPFCCAVIDNSMADVDSQTNALTGIKPRRVA